MKKETDLLNMKMELLRSELFENRVYMEVAAITIFFMIIGFLGTNRGLAQIYEGTAMGYIMLFTAIALLIIIIYMFGQILYTINKKMEKVKKQKKVLIRDFIEDDTPNTYNL